MMTDRMMEEEDEDKEKWTRRHWQFSSFISSTFFNTLNSVLDSWIVVVAEDWTKSQHIVPIHFCGNFQLLQLRELTWVVNESFFFCLCFIPRCFIMSTRLELERRSLEFANIISHFCGFSVSSSSCLHETRTFFLYFILRFFLLAGWKSTWNSKILASEIFENVPEPQKIISTHIQAHVTYHIAFVHEMKIENFFENSIWNS